VREWRGKEGWVDDLGAEGGGAGRKECLVAEVVVRGSMGGGAVVDREGMRVGTGVGSSSVLGTGGVSR
jgi:hypothetical protein